ncbi:DUF4269 domain-containing protein [Pararcticibacter amylolyticus]|uniref:DUF4269 domain-containing protein n=1 Tax=Pararcticibacter amylolyticus TaxID=2173175 RepID=A0A2U2PH49_9SPHI|nr:DUF4269 domain-containing protein [Pararcticibacter amylolyticus]PWG80700.1 DUF4269 domain-containing protein [Pararcticibacter amylolyticus]
MKKFDTIEYLKAGNSVQQKAWKVLGEHRVMELLEPFDPVLTGTIPLEIDIPGSDMDIVCCWRNIDAFKAALLSFSGEKEFSMSESHVNGVQTVMAFFRMEDLPVEVFGQNRPVKQQEAYRHMMIEYFILQQKGEEFKRAVIELKLKGIKTEPAFAMLLGLEGDAYSALLDYPETDPAIALELRNL